MQNKRLIRFFAIIFAAVCSYQLTYTFITYNVEKDAEAYAERVVDRDAPNAPSLIEEARKRYLDSVSNIRCQKILKLVEQH